MDLKKRLANLDRLTRRPDNAPSGQVERTAGTPAEQAVHELGLEIRDTPFGPVFERDLAEEIAPPVGFLPDLGGFFSRPGQDRLSAADVLFLDTETTGLAGGTGTLAFLVGASWWEGELFRTRQLFLCSPAGEVALLQRLHRLAGRFAAVATYNGASFDLPLLRTRALMNRLDQPWDDLHSWDLLVPARRLWGRGLENCRQQTVERAVCGLGRTEQDIAGHLIPQTWFDFLQLGQTDGLRRVLYHNARDMAGMGHIFARVAGLADRLEDPRADESQDWRSAWALGLIAERRGEREQAAAWLKAACAGADRVEPVAFADRRFVLDALRVIKRCADWARVENIIAAAFGCGQNEWWLHREAAILYEHRLVDLERARRHALSAGDDHRLQRLRRKLAAARKEAP